MRFAVGLLAAFMLAATTPSSGVETGNPFLEQSPPRLGVAHKLTPHDPGFSYQLGRELDVDGDLMAATGPWAQGNGYVHVYRRTGGIWVEQSVIKVDPDDPRSVAVEGNRIAVGVTNAVIVYEPSGASWVATARIDTPTGENDRFGINIALEQDLLVVAATMDDETARNAGAVYVYRRSGSSWNLEDKLLGPEEYGQFGRSVDTDGKRIVAGSRLIGTDGAAWIFERNITWKGVELDPGPLDGFTASFGEAVAVYGKTAVVSAPDEDSTGDPFKPGRVFVFKLVSDSWDKVQTLALEGDTAFNRFGESLDLVGGQLLVSDNQPSDPVVHLYGRTGGVWEQTLDLAVGAAGSDEFGAQIVLTDGGAVVSAPGDDSEHEASGAIYTFDFNGPPPPPPGERPLVLFVQGITSRWSCSEPDDNVLDLFQEVLEPALGAADLDVFSYSESDDGYVECPTGPDANYEPNDTCDSIDEIGVNAGLGSAAAFLEYYDRVTADRETWIVAHSMGGLVSTYALATLPNLPGNLRGVITLDSPLQGQDLSSLHALIKECKVTDPVYADLNPLGSVPVALINSKGYLNKSERRIFTALGNNEDIVVWPENSHLPGAWLNLRINDQCPGDAPDHGCVFRNFRARQAMVASLQTPRSSDGTRPDVPTYLGSCKGHAANVIGSLESDKSLVGPADRRLLGSDWRDVIVGLGGNDRIKARGGNDLVCAGPGHDKVWGNGGEDELYGNSGKDTLKGGTKTDWLYGGSGRDNLYGNTAPDHLFGQGGNDYLHGGSGKDECDGGAGFNRLFSC